ncbi:hypothetical protein ASG33_09440 [Dyadobacter sp. Leaf189]|nr:hypothetical protein ASG33_09440 [Dyadobacter sp. Leaf189]
MFFDFFVTIIIKILIKRQEAATILGKMEMKNLVFANLEDCKILLGKVSKRGRKEEGGQGGRCQ